MVMSFLGGPLAWPSAKASFSQALFFAKSPNLTLEVAKSRQSLIQDFHLPLPTEAY
jgi:hypothetical protein